MNAKVIFTEDASEEIWRMLLKFSYEPNIRRFWKSNDLLAESDEKIGITQFITGAIRQSKAYFEAASVAPMDISPLLLYYGYTVLLGATAALVTQQKLPIGNHGLKLHHPAEPSASAQKDHRLANFLVSPDDPKVGGFLLLSKVFAPNSKIRPGIDNAWDLSEIFGSIPDLEDEVVSCYGFEKLHVLPVEISRKRETIERVVLSFDNSPSGDFDMFSKLNLVNGFNDSYLEPRFSQRGAAILTNKIGGKDLGIYSISGNKYLQVAHTKSNAPITLSPIMVIQMALYALGQLSRYYPEIWNSFVRTDSSNEYAVVKRFLSIVQRYGPNLILNHIYDARYHFSPTTDIRAARGDLPTIADWDNDEIEQYITDRVRTELNRLGKI
jgi:hypothetical protein